MAKEGQAVTLNDEEHQAFLAYLDTTRHALRDKAIYLLTYRAGMRIGTVAQLTLNDIIDTSTKLKKVVILRKSITKGKKTVSAYLSHPELREALEAYIVDRRNNIRDILFYSQKGGAFTPNTLSRLMFNHYKKAGFEGSSSHQGRRAFASNCLKAGMDIVALSKVMSHSSINTTMAYIHHDESELLGLIEKV
jgi:integrase/recombinase XerD